LNKKTGVAEKVQDLKQRSKEAICYLGNLKYLKIPGSAIPHLGIYPKEGKTGYSRGTCTPMFIAALFTTAKLWKQPRCPTTDEWIKRMRYLYTMELYLAMNKNEILSFASKWRELENIILSEVS
jgi:hypothetical protein